MFPHMEQNHGKFYSHMCGPPRPYQCSVCRRTMETEKQFTSHRCQEAKGPFKVKTVLPTDLTKVGKTYFFSFFQCHTCNVTCDWRSELVEHLNQRHNIRAKIDLKAKVQIEKERNLLAQNPTTIVGGQLPVSAGNIVTATTPIKVTTPSMKCQYCQDKFPNKARLMEHIRENCYIAQIRKPQIFR